MGREFALIHLVLFEGNSANMKRIANVLTAFIIGSLFALYSIAIVGVGAALPLDGDSFMHLFKAYEGFVWILIGFYTIDIPVIAHGILFYLLLRLLIKKPNTLIVCCFMAPMMALYFEILVLGEISTFLVVSTIFKLSLFLLCTWTVHRSFDDQAIYH